MQPLPGVEMKPLFKSNHVKTFTYKRSSGPSSFPQKKSPSRVTVPFALSCGRLVLSTIICIITADNLLSCHAWLCPTRLTLTPGTHQHGSHPPTLTPGSPPFSPRSPPLLPSVLLFPSYASATRSSRQSSEVLCSRLCLLRSARSYLDAW